MSWQDTLLNAEASAAERAVEKASASRYPLSWDLLRTLQSADHIPADKLAILAWAMSVDLWDADWSLEKKRSVVRTAIRDHSLKGTIAGVRRYLAIADATLDQYLAPPQMLFAGKGLDKAELEAWFETMPQLRIRWKSRPIHDPAIGLAFWDSEFLDADFAGFDRGAEIYGRQAFLYDRGVEIPLRNVDVLQSRTTIETRQTEQASTPGLLGESAIGFDFFDAMLFDATILEPKFYTFQLDGAYDDATSELAITAVPAGFKPISARYTRTSDRIVAGPSMFFSDFWDDAKYFEADQGEFMMFDRVYLHDPSRAVPFTEAVSFFDFTRWGMPPFTVEMMIDVPCSLPADAMAEGDFLDQGFLAPTNNDKINRAMDAVDLSKGYRDKALVTFETTRARRWADGLPLDGSVTFGDRLPATL